MPKKNGFWCMNIFLFLQENCSEEQFREALDNIERKAMKELEDLQKKYLISEDHASIAKLFRLAQIFLFKADKLNCTMRFLVPTSTGSGILQMSW